VRARSTPPRTPPSAAAAGLFLLALSGCRSSLPAEPPRPPTPPSVTRAEPGGDAPNPELAALERLAQQSWGLRSDRTNLVLVPLADATHWKRVRFWLVPAFTGFRYGDQHHGLAALFVRDAPGPDPESKLSPHARCLDDFERWALKLTRTFGADVSDPFDTSATWRNHPVTVRRRDGELSWLLSTKRYASVYASYAAWPGRCATLAFAFPMNEAEAAARLARERFAREAFSRFVPGARVPPVP
jgi:hypothetical protein